MSKKPKQSGMQTVTNQGTLPSWLDSRYQNAMGGADALYNSGGNPAVRQAQSAYDSALSRYNNQGSGFNYADNLPSDYIGIKDIGGGAYEWTPNPGTWQGAEGNPSLTAGEIALYVNGRGGGQTRNRSEVDSALAALNAAKAQPWDQSQDPLWQHKLAFSDPTQMGMQNALDISNSGVTDNAFNLWNDTLQGNYLYGGEGFNNAYDAASRRITPQVTSAFNAAGRMGGGAGADELGGQLGDAFAGLYNANLNRQMNALSMTPMMNNLAYDPAMRQMAVGGMQDMKNMENRDIDFANKNIPAQRLDQYLSRLGGVAPNYRGTTTQKPIYSSGGGIGSILGPALQLGGMFMGGAGGGLLGGIGGDSFGNAAGINDGYYAG